MSTAEKQKKEEVKFTVGHKTQTTNIQRNGATNNSEGNSPRSLWTRFYSTLKQLYR